MTVALKHFTERAIPVNMTGTEWEVVLLEAGWSKNLGEGGLPRYYPAESVKAAVPLVEGLRAQVFHFGDKLDHLPDAGWKIHPEGYASNIVGVYSKGRFGEFKRKDGTSGKGLLARLHILEGHKWLRESMLDAWKQGQYDLYQFSIDAEGDVEPGIVESKKAEIVRKIEKLTSTDVVSEGAAGGSLLRLVASTGIQEATQLGDYLTAEMGKKEITVEQLARAAGISASTMGGILRGEIARPPDRRLRGIARVLGVSFDRLLGMIPEDIRETCSLLDLVSTHRPTWLAGFEDTQDDQDETEFALRVFEGNYAKAQDELDAMDDQDKDALAEQSRGVKALASVIRLLRGGNVQDAVRLLQSWIEQHPATANGSAQGEPAGFYSYPYTDPQPATAGSIAPARQVASAQEDRTMSANEPTPAAPATTPTDLEKRVAVMEANILRRERKIEVRERVSESGLKKAAQTRVLELLDPKLPDVTDEVVDAAIQEMRDFISSLQESQGPTGLGSAADPVEDPAVDVQVGEEKYNRHVKAFQGYFEQKDVDGIKRFRTLREAYAEMSPAGWTHPGTMTKGIWLALNQAVARESDLVDDHKEHVANLRESWDGLKSRLPKRLRESIGSADFPTAFGDSLQIVAQKAYTMDERNDWRDIVSSIVDLKDLTNAAKIFRTGALKDLPIVPEKGAYPELTPVTLSEETASLSADKYGGVVIVSMEAIRADRDEIIKTLPTKMGRAAVRTLQKAVWGILEDNTVLTATSNAIVSAGHTNIVADVLSYANLITAVQLMKNQLELDSAEKLGLRPDTLWVPVELEDESIEILESEAKIVTNDDATTRSYVNKLGIKPRTTLGIGRVAGTQDQAYLVTKKEDAESIAVGFVDGKEEPEIMLQSPMDTPTAGDAFASDVLTYKIRHEWGVVPIDFRWVVGFIP